MISKNHSVLLLALAAAGCSSDDDDGGPTFPPPQPVTTYVGFERNFQDAFGNPVQVGSLMRGDAVFASNGFSVIANADEGLSLDYVGNAYQASDTSALLQTVRVLGRVRDRGGSDAVFRLDRDRDISRGIDPFDMTTLVAPKSTAVAHGAGLLIVADSGDPLVKVWGTAAAGNVAPFFTSSVPAAAWDVAYDESNDRLFAALVDGTIAVFDDFVAAQPAAQSRLVVPSTDGSTQSSTSLRGILHRSRDGADELVVTDIGVEGSDAGSDGSVLFIDGASSASGPTAPSLVLGGAAAGLRDPSDVAIAPDGRLSVTDPAVRRILVFQPIGGQARYQASPVLSTFVLSPNGISTGNGLAFEPIDAERLSGVSDIDDPAVALDGLVATTSPAGLNGELLRLAADLQSAPDAVFDVGSPILAATLDVQGDAHVAVNGGLAVVNRFAKQRGTGLDVTFEPSRDRTVTLVLDILNPAPTFVDPRTVEIDDLADFWIVSDPGVPGVFLLGRNIGPTGGSTRVLEAGFVAGTIEPWGLDYDFASDTLYVAVTSGAVYVYENFRRSPGDLPDRTITPADAIGATQVSTELRGLVHDAERDLLILADVGDTSGMANDGALFVIEGASTASGLTAATMVVEGSSTSLDQPLDLAWNGSTLWVADNGSGAILRFDDFLTLDGNVAPAAQLALPDVTSVDLNPSYLTPTSGGSILED